MEEDISMRKLMLNCLALFIAAVAIGPAKGQKIEQSQASTVVSQTAQLVSRHYFDPGRRAAIVQRLEESRAAGRYATTDPRQLAQRVTEDLLAVTNDWHMSLTWDPANHARLAAEASSPGPPQAHSREQSIRTNHGLEQMRILPGNVRYLRISAFPWIPDRSGAAYDAAMAFLREGDAVIVDLRNNGGGNASAERYAISHFMPGDHERLLMTFQDENGAPEQERVHSYLPGGRIIGKPLFVLVNGRTASAAEAFAYHVQQFRLGRIVGGRTAGAGNNNQLFPVAPGFVASISVYSPRHAVSGGNWERIGIAPDIDAKPAESLTVAHVAALEALRGTAAPAQQAAYDWALVGARGLLRAPPATSQLSVYQGDYSGRIVALEGNRLVYRRDGHPESVLVPLGDHLFAFDDSDELRARFRMQGSRAHALELVYNGGNSRIFPRSR
jgi:hypothetical protein